MSHPLFADYAGHYAGYYAGYYAGCRLLLTRLSMPLGLILAVALPTSADAQHTPSSDTDWAFEERFDGDPGSPSQALLPRSFEYVATHRSHPKEHFTKPYAAFPADHATNCTGPDPAVSPLPQHEVFTSQSSNSLSPDASFFICKNHMMSSMGEVAAYSNSLFWPRQAFDFRDGGTLEFDVNINEGHTIRSWWEVLIAPREQMRFSSAPLQSAVDETYPRDRIVLDFRGNVRQIRVGKDAIAPAGWIVEDRHFGPYDFREWRDLHPGDPALEDRRIRRKMRIRFETDRIIWGIETATGTFDEFAVDVPGGLPFDRGIVQFKTHAYTPYKLGNQSTYTFHWDNIRFSGPALAPYATYHADDVVYLQRNGDRAIGDEVAVRIDLPEAPGQNPVLVGQINAPLNGQPLLSINGGPDIVVGPDDYPVANCVSGEWRDWVSFRLPLDAGDLRAGENTLRWKVGPRPACASGQSWWDGYSAKFVHIQTDGKSSTEPAAGTGNLPPSISINALPNTPPNTPPTTSPNTPSPTLALALGEPLTLRGTANDAEDGDISLAIRWLSNLDGLLGDASTLTVALSEGEHTITATVADSGGLSAAASVGVTIAAASDRPATEFIVDDRDRGKVTRRGGWRVSSRPKPWEGRSLYSTSRASTFRWNISVPVRDSYEVYVWWTSFRGRSKSAPFTVSHEDGTDLQYKNQRRGGGRWQLLGTYSFTPDGGHYVELSGANGMASADAVRVVTAPR